MSRKTKLTPFERAYKRATRAAVHAAGGQDFAARELGRSQSVINDYCNGNKMTLMPIDMVPVLEQLAQGEDGSPHITRLFARQLGADVVFPRDPENLSAEDLGDWLAAITRENADLAVALASQDLQDTCAELSPRARSELMREVNEQMAVLRRLAAALDDCAPTPVRLAKPDTS